MSTVTLAALLVVGIAVGVDAMPPVVGLGLGAAFTVAAETKMLVRPSSAAVVIRPIETLLT
ncbi:hypothetical protein GCM10010170_041690 [Dactylosporangium salmoneum]|uniref:Uncharacterized protein n=1 Tax=Dactylosporangium salmoneum TaxID=53361 RepID=A0ABP5TGH6_9ACTN